MFKKEEDSEKQIYFLEHKLRELSITVIPSLREKTGHKENRENREISYPGLFGPEYISGNLKLREEKFNVLKNYWDAELTEVKIKMNKEINFSKSGEYNNIDVNL